MTLKEFEDLKKEKTQEEYEDWFDEQARFTVRIDSIDHLCVKITSKKVALRDGTLFTVNKGSDIIWRKKEELYPFKDRNRIMQIYDMLDAIDRVSIRSYFDALETKIEIETAAKRRAEMPEGTVFCSFCNKSQDEVRKLIAGPGNAFICDECIDICKEIMEEEFEEQSGGKA